MPEFDPSQPGALYSTHRERWQLELDFSEMTLDILSGGTYLDKFSSKEEGDDYNWRKAMSAPFDMCRDGVQIRSDNIWRTPPKREVGPSKYKEIIETIIADADREGTNLDAFMRRALWNQYVSGVDIVTQMPAVPPGEKLESQDDQKRLGMRPYFMQFGPLQRIDWATTGSRNLKWARYSLGTVPKATEDTSEDERAEDFLTLTAEGWQKWRVVHKKETNGAGQIHWKLSIQKTGEGLHSLGDPPIVKFYFNESEKAGQGAVPLSLLTRPAVVARKLLNLISQADAELLANIPRWFASGVGEELPDTYGAGILIKCKNEAASLNVVQGSSGHLSEKREWIMLYVGEILRLLKFRGGMGQIEGQAGSGIKLALERTDLENELRSTATQLEEVELEMMRQACVLATGADIPRHRAADELDYEVAYNRDFVLEPVNRMIENIALWLTKCWAAAEDATEISREMTRQLANALVRTTSPTYAAMMEEIDAGSFGTAGGEQEEASGEAEGETEEEAE